MEIKTYGNKAAIGCFLDIKKSHNEGYFDLLTNLFSMSRVVFFVFFYLFVLERESEDEWKTVLVHLFCHVNT